MSNNQKITIAAIKYLSNNSVFPLNYNIILRSIYRAVNNTLNNLIIEYKGYCLYLYFKKIFKDNNVSYCADKKHNNIINLIDSSDSKYKRCFLTQDSLVYLEGMSINDLRYFYSYSGNQGLSELYDKVKTIALLHEAHDKGKAFCRNLSLYLPNKEYININLRNSQGKHFFSVSKIFIYESFHYIIISGYVLGVKGNNYAIRYYVLDRNREYKLLNEVYLSDVDKLNPEGIFTEITVNHSGITLMYDNFKKYVIEFKDPPYYIFDHVYVYSDEYSTTERTYATPIVPKDYDNEFKSFEPIRLKHEIIIDSYNKKKTSLENASVSNPHGKKGMFYILKDIFNFILEAKEYNYEIRPIVSRQKKVCYNNYNNNL